MIQDTAAQRREGSPTGRQRINSVVRAIASLEQIASSASGLTVRESSDLVGIESQTTYHLVHTLEDMQFIARGIDRRYRLGVRVGNLIEPFSRQFSAPDYLNKLVRALAQETGETSYGVGWVGQEIVVLSVVAGTNAVRTAEMPHGHHEHAHSRAAGKLLLAHATAERRQAYLSHHPAVPLRSNTLVSEADLGREFARIREHGLARDIVEFAPGVSLMAAALNNGDSPFSIAFSAPADRFRQNYAHYERVIRRIASS